MLDNPKIRLSADKSPSTINDDVICSALGAYFCHQKKVEGIHWATDILWKF